VRDGEIDHAAGSDGPLCLTDDAVLKLAGLVHRITAHAGGQPQDVEWSFGGGEFHVLQARPITTLVDDPD
jgi:phosphoenolpyruvate synthase/pyruvate phosphate dikinase